MRKTHDRSGKYLHDERLSRAILYLLRYGASFTILYGIIFMYEFPFCLNEAELHETDYLHSNRTVEVIKQGLCLRSTLSAIM